MFWSAPGYCCCPSEHGASAGTRRSVLEAKGLSRRRAEPARQPHTRLHVARSAAARHARCSSGPAWSRTHFVRRRQDDATGRPAAQLRSLGPPDAGGAHATAGSRPRAGDQRWSVRPPARCWASRSPRRGPPARRSPTSTSRPTASSARSATTSTSSPATSTSAPGTIPRPPRSWRSCTRSFPWCVRRSDCCWEGRRDRLDDAGRLVPRPPRIRAPPLARPQPDRHQHGAAATHPSWPRSSAAAWSSDGRSGGPRRRGRSFTGRSPALPRIGG